MDWRKVVVGLLAALVVFDVVANVFGLGFHQAPAVTYTAGQNADVAITLVSTDARALACAGTEEVNGRHCEYETQTQRWTKPPSDPAKPATQTVLAPYKTSDDVMLLIPGLFSEPALQQRLSIDPPNFGQEHSRFLAHCKMHIEAKMAKFDVRWQTSGPWYPSTDVWTATVSGCTISDP